MGVKHYDKQFKERAVKLSKERGNMSAVARELGVSASQPSKWCRAHKAFGDNSFLGRGVPQLTND